MVKAMPVFRYFDNRLWAEIVHGKRASVLALHNYGISQRLIACQIHWNQSAGSRTIMRYQQSRFPLDRPYSVRSRPANDRQKRYLHQVYLAYMTSWDNQNLPSKITTNSDLRGRCLVSTVQRRYSEMSHNVWKRNILFYFVIIIRSLMIVK